MSQRDRAVKLIEKHGILRCAELIHAGIHPETLSRLVKEGAITRDVRGLYQSADVDISTQHGLAEVAKLVPKGIICLVSALQFHELTLQLPRQVWVAIHSKARKPKVEYPPIRVARFGKAAFSLGVQVHSIDGVSVPVFSPAKTVVDCFRFRKAVGLDVALEALHNVMESGQAKPAEIAQYAYKTRIWSVLQPYLETVAADGA